MSKVRTFPLQVTKLEERLILITRSDPTVRDYVYGLVNLSQPTNVVTFDPKGGIKCTVDPKCKWTGKSSTRAGVHATDREDLKVRGHLARY